MNRRMVFYIIGQIVRLEAAFLVLPLIVSLIYGEECYLSFLITIAIALVFGTLLTLISNPEVKIIYAKEGFVIVALAWLFMSAVGALPFILSGEIPSFVDAFFETVSGFTTTGSSILNDVEALSHGILFWRSFTHWIGGMGVLVFIMAIVPSVCGDRSIHILRAEMPGPVMGKLVPKLKQTAKILYLIYIGLTVIEAIFLFCGGMSLFESVVHSFGTAGTGGFGVKADSIGSYSPYIQWVITVFMFLFGINFNLYYLILVGKIKTVFKSSEMWTYTAVYVISVAVITANIFHMCSSFAESIRLSAFQVAAIVTTTGYATADFTLWPGLSKGLIFILMFMGGCAGSTAGGLKVSRIMILFKLIRREIMHVVHPRSVSAVRLEGKKVDDSTLNGVSSYFVLFMVIFFSSFIILSFDKFDFETNITAVTSCLNNIGPGLGAIGPASSFASYSILSKLTLSVAMLLGRLEIYPLLITLVPSTWSKKY